MSEIKSASLPIPIKYSKSWHSFSDPNNQIQKYLFELHINLKSGEKKIFRNLENNTYSNLIFLTHRIKFSDIQDFNICVSKLPFDYSFNYELDGLINHEQSSYINKNENIYIEFSQNSNGYTICNSRFVGSDYFKISVSPSY